VLIRRHRDLVDAVDRALLVLIIWTCIGWLPMGAIGFGVGLVMGYFSGTLNEYTTGATLTGMALYIPVGILAYHLYLKRLY
jgi:hypothetical protein